MQSQTASKRLRKPATPHQVKMGAKSLTRVNTTSTPNNNEANPPNNQPQTTKSYAQATATTNSKTLPQTPAWDRGTDVLIKFTEMRKIHFKPSSF